MRDTGWPCAAALPPLQRLPEFDADMAKQAAEAEAAGECLRYVGVVDVKNGQGSVELRRYPKARRRGLDTPASGM